MVYIKCINKNISRSPVVCIGGNHALLPLKIFPATYFLFQGSGAHAAHKVAGMME